MMVIRFHRVRCVRRRTRTSRFRVLRLRFLVAFGLILLLALLTQSDPAVSLHAATPFPTPIASLVAKPRGQTVPAPTDTPPGQTVPPAPPKIFISEFLANPDAVNDNVGEWIELYNGDSMTVNLRGWRIADLGGDSHTIADDLTIEPGSYAVIGRNGDRMANGGVDVAYVYSSFSLANGDDEIFLFAPGGVEIDDAVDKVVWKKDFILWR